MKVFFGYLSLACLATYLLMGCQSNTVAAIQATSNQLDTNTIKTDTINIIAVGDIMLGSPYPNPKNLPPDDAIHSFKAVISFLKGDVVFGNLEGCFLDSGKSSKCKDTLSKACYAFRMPNRYGKIIKEAGFNVLSIANNHIGDFDAAGRMNTAKILDSLQIQYAGQLNKPYTIFEKDNIKYAFCAFAPNENTVSLLDIANAKKLVTQLKEQADVIIVSFHGGAEGAAYEHLTRQSEFFHKENRGNVYAFAHAVIDSGADVVLGHGPHVTRAVEVYKNKFIAYSLGNFCTYGQFNLKEANGFAPLLQLKINANGDFLYADVVSVKQDKIRRLTLDKNFTAFKKIQTLTDLDFKGHGLKFENNQITLNN